VIDFSITSLLHRSSAIAGFEFVHILHDHEFNLFLHSCIFLLLKFLFLYNSPQLEHASQISKVCSPRSFFYFTMTATYKYDSLCHRILHGSNSSHNRSYSAQTLHSPPPSRPIFATPRTLGLPGCRKPTKNGVPANKLRKLRDV